jgi:hypothetical protein
MYGGIMTLTKPTFEAMQDSSSEVRRVMRQVFPQR